jgi:alkylhydroperoxidase family enzyme
MIKPGIEPIEPPYSPETQAALARWMGAAPMEPLALFRVLLRHPRLAEKMWPLGSALLGRRLTLPPRLRELAILRTCARLGAEYEWGVHVTIFAQAVGLDATAIAATAGDARALDGRDAEVVRAVDELHDTGTLADRSGFSDEELLELCALAGFYHLISFVANAARVPLEPWAARLAGQ